MRRAGWSIALVGAALLAGVLYRYDPMRVGFYPRCPLFVLTGLYCPGCGTLRAGHALLHGHLLTALGYNAFAVLAAPVFAYLALSRLIEATGRRPLPAVRIPGPGVLAILAGMILFTVLRNVPVEPFSILAP